MLKGAVTWKNNVYKCSSAFRNLLPVREKEVDLDPILLPMRVHVQCINSCPRTVSQLLFVHVQCLNSFTLVHMQCLNSCPRAVSQLLSTCSVSTLVHVQCLNPCPRAVSQLLSTYNVSTLVHVQCLNSCPRAVSQLLFTCSVRSLYLGLIQRRWTLQFKTIENLQKIWQINHNESIMDTIILAHYAMKWPESRNDRKAGMTGNPERRGKIHSW